MGDDTVPTSESTQEMLRAFEGYGPAAVRAMTSVMPDAAWQEFLAKQRVALPEAQLQADVYSQVAPQLNRTAAQVDRENQLAASQTELSLVNGSGAQLTEAANRLQAMVDPEFYRNKAEMGDQISALLSGLNPNAMSETERENIARGLARTNGTVPTSTATTVENAMVFGDALNQKRAQTAAILAQLTPAMQGTRSGIDGFNVATRRSVAGNAGNALFRGLNENAGHTGATAANQFMGQIGEMEKIRAQKYKSGLTRALDGFKGVTEGVGNLVSVGM